MTEVDVFDGFDEIDEIAGYVFHETGSEGLQALLHMFITNKTISRDGLLDIADSLDDAGLADGANIIREAAQAAPTKAVVEIARILNDPYPCNIRYRLTQGVRRGIFAPEDMEAAWVDPEIIDYVRDKIRAVRCQ
jgi:hypothetical protein